MSSKYFFFFLLSNLSLFVWDTSLGDDKEEKTEISLIFNLSDPEIEVHEENDIENKTAKAGTLIRLPSAKLVKEGSRFTVWTTDGFYRFERGEVFNTGTEDVVFTPDFSEIDDTTHYKVKYSYEFEGEELNETFRTPDEKHKKNTFVEPPVLTTHKDKAIQEGWMEQDNHLINRDKFIMPAKDVVLKINWSYFHRLVYSTGDVDDIVGNKEDVFIMNTGLVRDLAEETRFSRKGYVLIGWHCDYDDKDYEIFEKFIMPDSDVTCYAIWDPVSYTIPFDPWVNGAEVIKFKEKTGKAIIIPEINAENEGYTFDGWSYGNEIYMPGDKFIIKGTLLGEGYRFTAKWIKDK